jgi:hypothetical protein
MIPNSSDHHPTRVFTRKTPFFLANREKKTTAKKAEKRGNTLLFCFCAREQKKKENLKITFLARQTHVFCCGVGVGTLRVIFSFESIYFLPRKTWSIHETRLSCAL